MSPHETLFLEATAEIRKADYPPIISSQRGNSIMQFQLLDFPGGFEFFDKRNKIQPQTLFNRPGALVFVIDAQDEESYRDAVDYFMLVATTAHKVNPQITYEILIHKVDGDAYLTDEHRLDCQTEIKREITAELKEANLAITPTFHITSIYDHTIFEAFSRIVQRLNTQLGLLENLLDGLIGSCGMNKAILFDVISKVYVATDRNPMDMQIYELCSDMIDLVIDVSCIYDSQGGRNDAILGFDDDSASVIRLNNTYLIYMRQVNHYLALVCLMPKSAFEKSGLVEYNFNCFKEALNKLFKSRTFVSSNGSEGLGIRPPILNNSAQGGNAGSVPNSIGASGASSSTSTSTAASSSGIGAGTGADNLSLIGVAGGAPTPAMAMAPANSSGKTSMRS